VVVYVFEQVIFCTMNDIYASTVPTLIKLLGGLKNLLDKMEAFAGEKKVDPSVFLNDRLAPDMFDCKRQIQIACDQAKGAVSRLTGTENPKHDDAEVTATELKARIDKTLAFIASVPENAYEKAGEQKVQLPYFPGKYMTGVDYAREYVLPNFIFHVTVAYVTFRHLGVPIGKADFMNGLPLKDLVE
jgi:uncharacterized protein